MVRPQTNRIQQIARLCAEEHLSLFIGAGVSRSCGLPSWEDLAAKIVEKVWPNSVQQDYAAVNTRRALNEGSPLDSMRLARRALQDRFDDVLRQVLYDGGGSCRLPRRPW